MTRLLTFFALFLSVGCAQITPSYDHVLAISVDGLRSDALIAGGPDELPHFHRLMQEGVGTLNARTDPDFQVTLPNHTSMLTGRFVTAGPTAHGWTGNSLAPAGAQLLDADGEILPGAFDDCKENGVLSALFAGKDKFQLFTETWEIDQSVILSASVEADVIQQQETLTHAVLEHFEKATLPDSSRSRQLVFLHYLGPDVAGHMHNWDMTEDSAYRLSVQEVDRQLGLIFEWLDAHPHIRSRTAILLTADHGGGSPSNNHWGNAGMWINYIIPFLTWAGETASVGTLKNNDLYAINLDTRKDPSLQNPHGLARGLPPIRNGEIANLARHLLGLPSLHGSSLNARQDLVTQP